MSMTQLFQEVIDMSLKNSKNIDKPPPPLTFTLSVILVKIHQMSDFCAGSKFLKES